MADDEVADDPRRMLLDVLLQKVEDETYPSVSILDLIELLLQPDEVPEYVEALLQRIREETYPSMPLLRRLVAFT